MLRLSFSPAGPRSWRLSTKLVVLMALVALAPLGMVIWQYHARSTVALEESLRIDLQRAARDTAVRIDNRLLERKRQVLAFASNLQIRQFASDPDNRTDQMLADAVISLYGLTSMESLFDGAFLADPHGEILASFGASPVVELARRDFFKASVLGTASFSALERLPDGRRVIFYSAPVRSRQNEVSTILVLQVLAEDIEQYIEADRGRLGPGSAGTLWERSGIWLSGSARRSTGRPEPAMAHALADVRDTSYFRTEDENGALVHGAHPVLSQTWIYTLDQPEAVVLERVNAGTRFSLVVFLVAALAVVLASIGLARVITRPLKDLQRTAGAIRLGDFSARAVANGKDELSEVAASLNQMLDELTALVQTREERDRMQQQIITLLSEVSTAAQGDLTIEAQVTDGALGSVADAFNYMIGELRTIIANVNETTVQVSSSTGEILAASNTLVNSAGAQAEQIAAATRAVEEMSASIGHVSENARISSAVAGEARHNVHAGLDSVRATMGGMQRIRGQVQQTAKQIKRLGESSQEIGQIVLLIEEIADQTNLLALNAAIQASMAGEHGRGFAVVADEVRRLSERAAAGTKQISTLVKSIQAETTQAVIAMENNTQEVVEGSRLADAAGQSLEQIDSVVTRLASLNEAISQAAEQQAEVSRNVVLAMSEISDVTQNTSAGTQRTAESVGYLARLADQLRSSVAMFRLSSSEA